MIVKQILHKFYSHQILLSWLIISSWISTVFAWQQRYENLSCFIFFSLYIRIYFIFHLKSISVFEIFFACIATIYIHHKLKKEESGHNFVSLFLCSLLLYEIESRKKWFRFNSCFLERPNTKYIFHIKKQFSFFP